MFAIAFDMDIKLLRNTYGEPYNNAYYEIKIILRKYNFFNTQGSVYLTENDDMANLFSAIEALKNTTWFKISVRDIRAFKVENWSDFTALVNSPYGFPRASMIRLIWVGVKERCDHLNAVAVSCSVNSG